LWQQGVFTADDGGSWRVEAGNLLVCERNAKFLVAVAMEPDRSGFPPEPCWPARCRWRPTAGCSRTTPLGFCGT